MSLSHANVTVFLTDGAGKFTLPNGRSEERRWTAGDVAWDPGERHLPENLSDQPIEGLVVELKARPAAPTKPPTARVATKKRAAKKPARRR